MIYKLKYFLLKLKIVKLESSRLVHMEAVFVGLIQKNICNF